MEAEVIIELVNAVKELVEEVSMLRGAIEAVTDETIGGHLYLRVGGSVATYRA